MPRTKNCAGCAKSKKTEGRLYDNKKSAKNCATKNCSAKSCSTRNSSTKNCSK